MSPAKPLPLQLVVPVVLGSWTGTAILDTNSSYTLINDTLWKDLRGSEEVLKPWLQGLLYLADGTGSYPLGWSEFKLSLQKQTANIPVVVLPTPCLALPVVLGLDFVFLSGLQFDVSENTYWFKLEVKTKYIFLKEEVAAPVRVSPQSHIAFYSAVSPAMPLSKFPSMSSLDVVLDAVIQSTHLDEAGRKELFNQQRCLHSKNWSNTYLVPQHSVIP